MRLELTAGTAHEYLEALGADGEKVVEQFPEFYESLKKIISLEVAYWASRRLSNSCGSVCDTLWGLRNEAIINHDSKYENTSFVLDGVEYPGQYNESINIDSIH